MRTIFFLFVILGCSALLSGCAALLAPLNPDQPSPEPVVEPTVSDPEFDPLADPAADVQCASVWASRHLPEFTELLQAAYRSAQMDEVAADVSGYGENCLHPETKEIVRYTILRSDFYLNLGVPDLNDADALSRKLIGALAILQQFPADTFPGTQSPNIFVRFDSGEETLNLSFAMTDYEQALEDGRRGAALLEALN
jgi:hypothetical protein